jgi:hypothetical protein
MKNTTTATTTTKKTTITYEWSVTAYKINNTRKSPGTHI